MMKPPLPVIRQPEAELGQLAGEYLIERIQGYTGEARVTRLPCKLLQP
jgi:DNA-binding LacI/PurR family transcriptional regulator